MNVLYIKHASRPISVEKALAVCIDTEHVDPLRASQDRLNGCRSRDDGSVKRCEHRGEVARDSDLAEDRVSAAGAV